MARLNLEHSNQMVYLAGLKWMTPQWNVYNIGQPPSVVKSDCNKSWSKWPLRPLPQISGQPHAMEAFVDATHENTLDFRRQTSLSPVSNHDILARSIFFLDLPSYSSEGCTFRE